MGMDGIRIPGLPAGWSRKLVLYGRLIRFEKPIGSYLLLWSALWALAIAGEGAPDPWVLFVFVTGVFLMRSSGCAINDYADREIDLHVARTRERPLTAGLISAREALAVFAVFGLVAFLLVLTLNRLTILLSFAGMALVSMMPRHWLRSWECAPVVLSQSAGQRSPIPWFLTNQLWANLLRPFLRITAKTNS